MKKILSILIIIISVFAFNVYASEVEITNIEVQENKHYTTNMNDPVIDNDSVDFNIKFEDYEQYIIYKITLNNNASIRYQYDVQYGDSFIDYEIVDEENIIDSKSSKDILLKVNYKDEIDESLYVDNLYNVKDNIKLLLQRPEEDKPTGIKGVIEEITENPKTGLFFNYGLVLILIIGGTIIYIRIKKNTDFKYNILIFVLLLPAIVYAANTKKITIDLNMDIEIVKPTIAIFAYGSDVRETMINMAPGKASSSNFISNTGMSMPANPNIYAVKRSFTKADGAVEIQNNTATTNDNYSVEPSEYKIYMWYDSNDKTIYYYSDAVRLLYHPMSYGFYEALIHLQEIDDIKTDILYDAGSMFAYTAADLDSISLDLSNWKMDNVNYISSMFAYFGQNTKNIYINTNNWKFNILNGSSHIFEHVGRATTLGGVENVTIDAHNWHVNDIDPNGWNPFYEVFYFVGDNAYNVDINATNWYLDGVTGLYSTFYGTGYTTLHKVDIDLTGFTAPAATSSVRLFLATAQSGASYGDMASDRNLELIINVTDWSIPLSTDYSEAFMQVGEYQMKSAKIIGLDTWDMSNVESINEMFYYFGMTSPEVELTGYENWDVSNVKDMYQAFAYVGRPASMSFDFSKWDTSSATGMGGFLAYSAEHGKEVYVNISGFDLSHCNSSSVVYDIGVDSDKMTFIANDLKLNPSTTSSLFSTIGTSAKDLTVEMSNIDLSGFGSYWMGQIGSSNNTAKYNLSNWKVNGNNLINIVSSASSIDLNLSGWEFTNANISYPISNSINGCNEFKVDMSDWKITTNTDIKYILQKLRPSCNSYELIMKNLDLTGFTDISGLFREFKNGGNYAKLDLSNWNTSTITNMSNLFYATFNGFGEADVDLSGWDISNVTNGTDIMTGFITSCGKATLKVKGWNMTKLNQFTNNMSATGINGQEFNLITQ